MNRSRPALLAAVSLLASLALPGCYANVEATAKRAAKHNCHRTRECNRSYFEDEYGGDIGRCRDDQYTDYLDGFDFFEELGCDYVPEEAKVCVKALRSLKNTCGDDADDEINDACEDVYSCPIGP